MFPDHDIETAAPSRVEMQAGATLPPFDGPLTPEGLEAVHEVPVRIRAVLGRCRIPIGELVRLAPGTVLELDRRVGEPVDIFVNDRLVARGEIVLIEQALGVTLTEIARPEQ